MFHFSTLYRQVLALSMDAIVEYIYYIIFHNEIHKFHIYLTLEYNSNMLLWNQIINILYEAL
jgi:hypothetical protein